MTLDDFEEVWCVDTEFCAPPGERPDPVCVVARELRSGRIVRQFQGEFSICPPFRVDDKVLYVAFYASAEFSTHIALGWALPVNTLDLYAEFRNATNGLPTPAGRGLLGALAYYGLDHVPVVQKEAGRDLVMRGGPWQEAERTHILDYCQGDVEALVRLLARMDIDLPRALVRGRYMRAAAAIEWNGIPIDAPLFGSLVEHWDGIKDRLIQDVDAKYGVFDSGVFKRARFEGYLAREGIPWPRLSTGELDLSDDTFRSIAKSEPRVAPLRELRYSLSQLRLTALGVGHDGRNRTLLSAFGSRTGRNQPSTTKCIFGPSVWLRGLIKPAPGHAIAYLDWKSQEFGIAAVLSGDGRMMEAYTSGDPYLALAKQAGVVPSGATKTTHKAERDKFKTVVLGVGYGMEAPALATRLGILPIEARELLQKHRETYPRFWHWSRNNVDASMSGQTLSTVFGWRLHPHADANPRSIMNFPMQANGAEMLRIACCLATERGVRVCAPVHDAILIEAPIKEIEEEAERMSIYMKVASRIVLGGFELGTEAEIFRYPQRYSDPRGEVMWNTAMGILAKQERAARASREHP